LLRGDAVPLDDVADHAARQVGGAHEGDHRLLMRGGEGALLLDLGADGQEAVYCTSHMLISQVSWQLAVGSWQSLGATTTANRLLPTANCQLPTSYSASNRLGAFAAHVGEARDRRVARFGIAKRADDRRSRSRHRRPRRSRLDHPRLQ